MAEIEFDELERVSLKKEVFLKLPLLRKYVYSEENYNRLIKYLHDIHLQHTERILDAISYVNDVLVNQFGQRITQETERLYYSSLLWEWFYLLAYYLHQIDDDPQWKENFLPHIKNFQIRPAALNEMEQGERLIDQYLDARWRVMETQQRLDTKTSEINSQQTTSREAQYLARIAELEARIKELEAGQIVKTKEAGRPRQILFESTKIETEQKEKIVALLKEHKLLGKYINCQKEKPINQYLTSIYWRWQEIGLVPEKPLLPTAFYHFLHDRCELKFDITQKSFTNFMGKILRHKEKYPEIWMIVRNEFQKQEA